MFSFMSCCVNVRILCHHAYVLMWSLSWCCVCCIQCYKR